MAEDSQTTDHPNKKKTTPPWTRGERLTGITVTISTIVAVMVLITLLKSFGCFEKKHHSEVVFKTISRPLPGEVIQTRFVITNEGDAPANDIVIKFRTFSNGNHDTYPNSNIVPDDSNKILTYTITRDILNALDSIPLQMDYQEKEFYEFNNRISSDQPMACDSVPAIIYFRANGKVYNCVSGHHY